VDELKDQIRRSHTRLALLSDTVCVYDTFLELAAFTDAGAAADLRQAQASCSSVVQQSSIALGNSLIGCIASACTSPCVGE
jgi:hypothetical protein